MIHKQILEEAEDRSDASMAELAEDVSGATVDIVERVLEEYGDPAEQTPDADGEDESDPEKTGQSSSIGNEGAFVAKQDAQQSLNGDVDLAGLTEKQLTTLRLIWENPSATQAELADIHGLSTATINTRVNSIEEFDWSNRQEFVRQMFENDESKESDREVGPRSDVSERVDELADEIESLGQQIDDQCVQSPYLFDHPELAHKVLHACFESEQITKEEELQIMEIVVNG